MAYNYQNPGWANGGPPPINATNLNAISTTLQAIGAAFDNGGDPAYIYGGTGNLGSNWVTTLQNALSSNWSATLAAQGQRSCLTTGGSLGTLSITTDYEYFLNAASTVTLPASPTLGQRITFKSKGNYTSTISANSGQTIGTTPSTSFVLYAQEDYVTLEWDGTSIWYVVATNGPSITAIQSSSGSTTSTGSWIGVGSSCGLSFSLSAGIYDLSLTCSISNAGNAVSCAIGNGTTPISSPVTNANGAQAPAYSEVKNYALNGPTTMQGIIYINNNTGFFYYTSGTTPSVGRLIARRIG